MFLLLAFPQLELEFVWLIPSQSQPLDPVVCLIFAAPTLATTVSGTYASWQNWYFAGAKVLQFCLVTVYVDSSDECNTLSFHLGSSSANREWAIRVTQYACDYENLAPKGCLQYFFDTTGTGNLESFNKANNLHLAGQNQNMCIRRESGNCRICYSTAENDFKISRSTGVIFGVSVSAKSIHPVNWLKCFYFL